MSSSSLPSAPLKRRRNLAQGVVAYLTDILQNGSLGTGDQLPTETEIMRTLAVSRTVVREAVPHLHVAGLVETRDGIGTLSTAGEGLGALCTRHTFGRRVEIIKRE